MGNRVINEVVFPEETDLHTNLEYRIERLRVAKESGVSLVGAAELAKILEELLPLARTVEALRKLVEER